MKRIALFWLVVAAGGLLPAGCRSPGCQTTPPPPQLPLTRRGAVRVEAPSIRATAVELPSPAPAYRELTAHDCQCLAARASSLANLLDAERSPPGECQGCCLLGRLPSRRRQDLRNDVLTWSADEARNRTAGAALESYYRLAEAEGRADLVRASVREVDRLVRQAEELGAEGFPVPADLDTLRGRQGELRGDAIRLQMGIDQLNTRLKKLLGLPPVCDDWPLWPADALCVAAAEPAEKEAVATGLLYRADLNLLRAVLDNLDARNFPAARQALATVSPLLAGPAAGPCRPGCLLALLASCLLAGEVEKVRGQVQALLDDREREAVREIREALCRLRAQRTLAALAGGRVDLARKRVAELQEKQAKGSPGRGELGQARLDLNRARGDLLHEVVEWEIARVQLRQAQGVLAGECAPPLAAPEDAHQPVTEPWAPSPCRTRPESSR